MKVRVIRSALPLLLVPVLVLAQEEPAAEDAPPDPAVELFVAKCASCHTVGKGVRVGPDLAGAHERRDREWLLQMIGDPNSMLARDPEARRLLLDYNNVRMPDPGITEDQVASLYDLIVRCSAEPCELAGKFVPVTEATEADFARGEAIFLGHERTVNGSVACISCHTVAGIDSFVPGGTLAVDLTHVFARLGDEGLDAALKNPAFPLMNKVFADHPLDPEEAFALRAFLYESNRGTVVASDNASLPLFGVLGTMVVLVILNAFWSRRLKGVRKVLTRSSP